MARGGVPSLKSLFRDHGDGVTWLWVYAREGQPGGDWPAHRSYAQKVRQAARFRADDQIPWPVLVDRIDGKVHRAYGRAPNPAFLVDAAGRLAFQADFVHGPTRRMAIEQRLAQDGRGVVAGGGDRWPHLLGATVYGWDALRRGGDPATRNFLLTLPPAFVALWARQRLQPALGPLARRSRPIPAILKVVLAGAALGILTTAAICGRGRASTLTKDLMDWG